MTTRMNRREFNITLLGIGVIIAYIEPDAGQARAFNRWYERDHMYETATAGPGAFSGARWVATRACKAMRPPGARWSTRRSSGTSAMRLCSTSSAYEGKPGRGKPDRMNIRIYNEAMAKRRTIK